MTQPVSVNLDAILLPTDGLEDAQIESSARSIYSSTFLGGNKVGTSQCHDGSRVLFFADQFDHAFYTSSNRSRYPDKKDIIALERVQRINWIKPVIEGKVTKTACYQFFDYNTKRTKRFYLVPEYFYVVWLEPRMAGGWKFATAYKATIDNLRRYCKGGVKIWVAP